MYPHPPGLEKSDQLVMVSEIARLPVHGEDEHFSIAFMFSPIYLRLEGNVLLPPRNRNFPVQIESEISKLTA